MKDGVRVLPTAPTRDSVVIARQNLSEKWKGLLRVRLLILRRKKNIFRWPITSDEAAGGGGAVEEESTSEQQGKVARREETARVKKQKAKKGRDRKKAATEEADRALEAARVKAGGEVDVPRINCCLKCVLSRETECLVQKEWLTTVVTAAGFTIRFFPKYHCEFNFIGMI